MTKQYHILNGDALREQFPEDLSGEIIVVRECLVDGNVNGFTLNELYKVRADFISTSYAGFERHDYFEKTATEFQRIQHIPNHVDVNLWFEDDLFCQVNFWFVINLLSKTNRDNSLFLIRSKSDSPYGFGGLTKPELISAYEHRTALTELNKLTLLWEYYQSNDTENLVTTAAQLKDIYPFIHTAVNAHLERIPCNESLGRPTLTLIEIIKELNTDEFAPIFKEFCKRAPIYGFGDLQVKRLLDEIKKGR